MGTRSIFQAEQHSNTDHARSNHHAKATPREKCVGGGKQGVNSCLCTHVQGLAENHGHRLRHRFAAPFPTIPSRIVLSRGKNTSRLSQNPGPLPRRRGVARVSLSSFLALQSFAYGPTRRDLFYGRYGSPAEDIETSRGHHGGHGTEQEKCSLR